MMLRVLSVSGVCSVMKSARVNSSSSSTFSTPRSMARSCDRNGIVGDHLHLQADGAVGDDRADIAAADDAERLAEDLHAHEAVLLPLAGAGGGVGFRDLAGQRQHQRDGVLGGGDGIAEGRVHHDDALGGGGRDVDIVDADAGAADHLQVLGRCEDLRRHLGGRADGEAVEVADRSRRACPCPCRASGWKSTSMPRSLKICTAAGERASEMRTLGMCVVLIMALSSAAVITREGAVSQDTMIACGEVRASGVARHAAACAGHDGCVNRDDAQLTPPSAARPWLARRPSRARASAPRRRSPPPWRRTRCAGPAARRGNRRCRRRRLPSPGCRRRFLAKAACASARKRRHRRIDHLQADRGVGARAPGHAREMIDPGRALDPVGDRLGVGVGARDGGLAGRRPTCAQSSASR